MWCRRAGRRAGGGRGRGRGGDRGGGGGRWRGGAWSGGIGRGVGFCRDCGGAWGGRLAWRSGTVMYETSSQTLHGIFADEDAELCAERRVGWWSRGAEILRPQIKMYQRYGVE